jgi:hypothetical protein
MLGFYTSLLKMLALRLSRDTIFFFKNEVRLFAERRCGLLCPFFNISPHHFGVTCPSPPLTTAHARFSALHGGHQAGRSQ